MTSPHVTVLTPTFNRRDVLAEAVSSVIRQTHADWEMLVINDGGEDAADVVAGFNDRRLRYINRRRNRGKAACLNLGLKEARGRYIAYIDDDDVWYPHHLAVLTEALDRRPEIGAAYSDLYAVNFIKDERNGRRYPLHKFIQVARDYNRDFMFTYNHTLHVSLMHRKRLALQAGGYDESISVLIDWNMTRKLSFFTDFEYIPRLTGEYYIPIGKSDRISSLQREDAENYKHNLRKIKADLPPRPWPKVETVAVVFPIFKWSQETAAILTDLTDAISYPCRFILVNCDHALQTGECHRRLGKIGALKNIDIQTPPKPLSIPEAYRFGAQCADTRYVYLPSPRVQAKTELRLISAMHYLKRSGCEGAKWSMPQERQGEYDIIMLRDRFLQCSDPHNERREAVLGVVPAGAPDTLSCDFFLKTAEYHYARGNYKFALQSLQTAEKLTAGGARIQFLMDLYAKICFDLKRYDQAEEKIRQLIDRGYGADNWIRLGRILQTRACYPSALEAYDQALKEIALRAVDLDSPVFPIKGPLDFGSFTAMIGMADCLIEMGDGPAAARMLRRAAKLKANSHRPPLGFARLFLKTGDLDRAEQALEAARQRQPDAAEVYRLRGDLLRRRRRPAEAWNDYLEAHRLAQDDDRIIEPLWELGMVLGRHEPLQRVLQAFLQFRPGHVPSLARLAELHWLAGRVSRAAEYVRRGSALNPDDPLIGRVWELLRAAETPAAAEHLAANGGKHLPAF